MTRDWLRPHDHPHETFIISSVVGSHPRPDWLEETLTGDVEGDHSDEEHSTALDECCRTVIRAYEDAGLDVVTDGEIRRDGMVEHFTRFIDGYDAGDEDQSSGWNAHMPTVTDEITGDTPWLVADFRFADSVAHRPVKVTLPGPFTFASFCSLEAYDDMEVLIEDFTEAVREEVGRLVDAGARWIQLDEPALGMSPHVDIARTSIARIATAVPNDVRLGLHVCSGNYETLAPAIFEFDVDEVDLEFASDDADDMAAVLGDVDFTVDVSVGVVDSQAKSVESVDEIKANIREALRHVPANRLTVTPDCGLKPLPPESAIAKVDRLATATREIESELDANRLDVAIAD